MKAAGYLACNRVNRTRCIWQGSGLWLSRRRGGRWAIRRIPPAWANLSLPTSWRSLGSDQCFSVQIARKLLERGISPVGNPEMANFRPYVKDE